MTASFTPPYTYPQSEDTLDTKPKKQRWKAGDPIVIREVWQGKVWSGRPASVVLDTEEMLALYAPAGQAWRKPVTLSGGTLRIPKEEWKLADEHQRIEVLRLAPPGAAHSVLVLWLPGFSRFLRWYVNLEEPLHRTPIGFDYMDMALDIVITEDQTEWKWKDEDEFQEAQDHGLIGRDQARQIREEGHRVLETMQAGRAPFNDGWQHWRPDPSWPAPTLPAGWDRVG